MSHKFFLFFSFFCPQLILHFSSISSKFLHFSVFSLFFSTFAESRSDSRTNPLPVPGNTNAAGADPALYRNNRENSAGSLPSALLGAEARAFHHEKILHFLRRNTAFSCDFAVSYPASAPMAGIWRAVFMVICRRKPTPPHIITAIRGSNLSSSPLTQ